MSTARFSTLQIKNSGTVPMAVFVTDPDGMEHFITTLAAGAETTQFTPAGATWQLRLAAGATESPSGGEQMVGPLDLDSGGKGERSAGG